ncbi:MAG: Na+/H+ antiporter [Cyanobacteria bacterium REEB67]|nr:Na+/H+ antiporter [Cyanobacteria bacterium REEB67]
MVASAVGLAVRFVRLPYSIALVIVGLFIGACHLLPPVTMTPELILLVCLPALLFEASWNLNLKELARNWRPIILLAVPGVLVSMAVAGFVLHTLGHLAWPLALLFGAITAATDPISVLALFRKMGIDKRLSLILEAESLFNDGTAVVLFKLILGIALSYVASTQAGSVAAPFVVSPGALAGSFVISVCGGALVGLFVGYCLSYVTKFFDDHLLEITLTAICAYGSYLLAEQLHVSPVIAVLIAGIVVGNFGSRVYMGPATRLAVDSFWEYAAFIVNSIVFLLIGLQIDFPLLVKYGSLIGCGILSILAARLVLVYLFGPLLSTKELPISLSWRHMLFWGAIRGSLSMALALSLPYSFAPREEMIVLTFGVTLFTLLVPGLTIEPLAKILKLAQNARINFQYERLKGKLFAEKQALNTLDLMVDEGMIGAVLYEEMAEELRLNIEKFVRDIEDLKIGDDLLAGTARSNTERQLLEVRKDALTKLLREHGAERSVVEELVLEIDKKMENLKTDQQILEADNDGK